MARNIVEVRAGVGEDLLAGRQVAGQNFSDVRNQASKHLIEHRAIQCLFILEVVIQQGLVHLGGTGNSVRPGSGNALASKFAHRSLQNRGPALLRPSPRTQARFGIGGHLSLINRLVRWYQRWGGYTSAPKYVGKSLR